MNSLLKCHASVIQSNQLQQSLTIMLLVMLWKNILYSNIFRKPQLLAFSCNRMIQCLHFSEILTSENLLLPTFLQNVSCVEKQVNRQTTRKMTPASEQLKYLPRSFLQANESTLCWDLYLNIWGRLLRPGHSRWLPTPRTPRWSLGPFALLHLWSPQELPDHRCCCWGPADPPPPQKPLQRSCLHRYRQGVVEQAAGTPVGQCTRK